MKNNCIQVIDGGFSFGSSLSLLRPLLFHSYMLAAARQPNMSAKLLPYCILGFALSEALALFTLLIALLELFVFS